jgi:prepilin-type N-terminal cleavage/methylation domain-containing protein
MKRVPVRPNPSGFTLVELLVVIAIIGILVGMTVTGIAFARRSAASAQISMEVSQLAQAVEDYRLKYGDYPPDFSDVAVVKRHFRKAFPKILNSEIALIENAMLRFVPTDALGNLTVNGVDRAEALVFCLGGFSEDPQKPFTGKGGPLQWVPVGTSTDLTDANNYGYNTDRTNKIFDFNVGRLTIITDSFPLRSWDDWDQAESPIWASASGNNGNYPASKDGTTHADPFPAYVPSGREMPYVYFDSRTYTFVTDANGYFFNFYSPRPNTASDYKGIARPYKSTDVRTASLAASAAPTTPAELDKVRHYAAKDSFQILAAGFDDHFGGVYAPQSASFGAGTASFPVQFIAQTGAACSIDPANFATWPKPSEVGVDNAGSGEFKYSSGPTDLDPLAQQDNVASFSSGTLISNITE